MLRVAVVDDEITQVRKIGRIVFEYFPDSAKLPPQSLPKIPKIRYNRSIRKAEETAPGR